MSSGGWRAQNTGGSGGRNRPGTTGPSLKARRAVWLVATLAVAATVIALLISLGFDRVPPMRVVAVGMTLNHPSFPARQSARTTAAAFAELHQTNPEQFLSPDLRESDLHGDRFLDRLEERLQGSSGQTLFVYLNCLGGLTLEGDVPAAQLLTVNAEPEAIAQDRSSELVPVRSLLERLAKIDPDGQAIVLFDGYTAPANWRVGLLNRDFPAVLKREAEAVCNEFSHLHVICACDAGESAGLMDETTPARSALGHFAVAGLRGDADQNGDNRVSIAELVEWLQGRVSEWSGSQRAVSQTVQYVNSATQKERDREIVQIRTLKLDELAGAAAAKPAESAKTEADAKSGDGAAEAGAVGDANADSKAAGAGSAEGGNGDGAAEKEPGEKESETGSAAKSGAADSDKADGAGADGAGSKAKSSAADPEAELALLKSRLKEFAARVEAGWVQRDQLETSHRPERDRPREWRQLNEVLVRADEQLRLGEDAALEVSLGQIGALLKQAESGANPYRSAFAGRVGLTSLAALKRQVRPQPATPEEAEAETARLAAFEMHWKALSSGMAEAEAVTAFETLYDQSASIRAAFYERVFQHALDSRLAGRDDFAKLGSLAALCRPVTIGDDTSPVPAELELLQRVCGIGSTIPPESIRDAELFRDFWPLCRQSLVLRGQFEELALDALSHYELLQPAVAESERPLVAAERWLTAGEAGIREARRWLDTAQKSGQQLAVMLKQVRDAAGLRAELLCQLPAYSRWCARTVDYRGRHRGALKRVAGSLAEFEWGTGRPFPTDVFEVLALAVPDRSHETRMLELMDRARRISHLLEAAPKTRGELQSLLDGSGTATAGLAALVDQANGLWGDVSSGNSGESLRGGIHSEIRKLASGVPSASNRSQVLAALELPWLELALRQQLLKQLQPTATSGAVMDRGVEEADTDHGEWEAFWCLHSLCLARLSDGQSRDAWRVFQSLTGADTEQRIAESVRTGVHLSELWTGLATRLENYSPGEASSQGEMDSREVTGSQGETAQTSGRTAWQAAFCVHPSDPILAQAEDPIAARHAARLKSLASDRTRFWMRRTGAFELLPGAARLGDAWSSLLPEPIKSSELPQLVDLVKRVNLSSSAPQSVEITVKTGTDRSLRFSLAFQGENVRVTHSGAVVRPEGLPVDTALLEDSNTIEVSLNPDDSKRPHAVTVLLLESADGLPLEIRQFVVHPPVDPTDWRIAFLTPDEISGLNGNGSGALPAAATDRNIPGELPVHLQLRLPPNVSAAGLKPVLLPPAGTSVTELDVEVRQAGRDGNPTGPPVAIAKKVGVKADGRPIPLTMASDAAASPAAPAAGTAPAAKPAAAGLDISGGIVFEILIPGEKAIRHLVQPSVRDARDLVREPVVSFRQGELTVRLERSPAAIDPLIPAELPIQLRLPADLKALNPDGQFKGNVSPSAEATLRAAFADISSFSSRQFPVFVDIADVPHVFAWYVKHEFPERALDDELRIEFPDDGVTVADGEPVVVALGVYARSIEEQLPGRAGWQLECRDTPIGSTIAPRRQTVPALREHAHSVKLSLAEGDWLFATTSTNHLVTLDTAGRTGVFQFDAKLVPSAGTTRFGQFEKKFTFGVDSKEKPPLEPELGEAVGFKQVENQWHFVMNGQPMTLRIDATDHESGVRKVLWGFDKGGAAGDETLTENEIIASEVLSELSRGTRTVTIEIPADKLPLEPGDAVLLVSTEDGLGTACRRPLKVRMKLVKPVKTGSLVLKMNSRDVLLTSKTAGTRIEIRQDGKPVRIIPASDYRNSSKLAHTLAVGRYDVVLVRDGKDQPPELVTIDEGKSLEHKVEL